MVTKKKKLKSRVRRLPKKKQSAKKSKTINNKTRKIRKSRVVLAVIIIALTIIFGAIYLVKNPPRGMNPLEYAFGKNQPQENQDVAALVNGQAITYAEVEETYLRLPEYYRASLTQDVILDTLIEEKLFLQAASDRGISVSEDEVQESINSMLKELGMTEEDMKVRLAQQNLSFEIILEFKKKELIVEKLFNETIAKDIQVTLPEIKEYYLENQVMFTEPEKIQVSHLIICHNESISCNSNRTKEEARLLIESIKQNTTPETFSDMAKKYSEEPGANESGGALPMLISKSDPVDPMFLDAAFNLEPGVISDVVETQFGYHLILVTDRIESSSSPFETVIDSINNTLTVQQQQDMISTFAQKLRDQAEIINYMSNQTTENS